MNLLRRCAGTAARWLLVAVLAAGLGLAVLYRDRFDVTLLAAWVRDAGVIAPRVFMLVYAVATVLFMPRFGERLRAGRWSQRYPIIETHINR